MNVGTHDLPTEVENGPDKKPFRVSLWRPYGDEFRTETDYAYIASKLKRPISECVFRMEGPKKKEFNGQLVKGRVLIGEVPGAAAA